jgi:hypothetical protein
MSENEDVLLKYAAISFLKNQLVKHWRPRYDSSEEAFMIGEIDK